VNSSARSRRMAIDASRARPLLQLVKPTLPIGTLHCVVPAFKSGTDAAVVGPLTRCGPNRTVSRPDRMGANIGNFRHAWVPQLPPGVGPISGIGSPRFSAGRQPRRDPEPQAELRADASFHQNRGPVFAGTPPFFWPWRGSAWMGGGQRPHSFGRAQVPRIPGLIGNDAPASPPAS
jgi:hypothetical protein